MFVHWHCFVCVHVLIDKWRLIIVIKIGFAICQPVIEVKHTILWSAD
jgi:hypothetical protein